MAEHSLSNTVTKRSTPALNRAIAQLRNTQYAVPVEHQCAWISQARGALQAATSALHEQLRSATATEELPTGVDSLRPTMERQARGVEDQQRAVLAEVRLLEHELQLVESAPTVPRVIHGKQVSFVPGFGVLQEWTAHVLSLLEGLQESEDCLVFDSVNIELGAGD